MATMSTRENPHGYSHLRAATADDEFFSIPIALSNAAVFDRKSTMPTRHTVRVVVAATAATLALALAGCGAPSTGTSDEPAPAMSDVKASAAAATPAEAAADALNTTPKFGETVTFDGLSLGVSAPEAFTPGEYAYGADQAANVKFTVTLTNTGDKGYDPTLTYITASSGQQEASQIFDDTLTGSPSTTILPGQAVSYQVGFSVADAAQIVMDVTGGFSYQQVTYTS